MPQTNKENKQEGLVTRQKFRSFEELVPADLLWSNLSENNPHYIYVVDRYGRLLFINKTGFGYKYDQIIGKEVIDFLPQSYRVIVQNAFRRCLKTGLPQDYETEVSLPKHKPMWFSSHVSPIRVNKKIVALIISSTDITEKKKAELELQKIHSELENKVYQRTNELQQTNESLKKEVSQRQLVEEHLAFEKEKMDQIYNNTRDGLSLYDSNGCLIYTNPSLRRLFGVKKEIVGATRKAIATNNSEYFKFRMIRSDDSLETQKLVYSGQAVTNVMIKILSNPTRYVEGNYIPIKDAKNNVVGMIASFRDVTLLKLQAERIAQNFAVVQREKNRWEAIFENIEEGVLILDRDMRIAALNSTAELMGDITEKEVIGKYPYEVFRCHDRFGHSFPDFWPVKKVYQTLEPIPYDEHIHTNSDGTERWVGVSYTPILDEDGKIIQCVCVNRDITAIKELEMSKSEFVSIASHELRTPLTIINGYLSLLLNGDLGKIDDSSAQPQYLNVINKVFKETKRLTYLVEELLNVSRIEEGRIKLRLRKDCLDEIITEVVRELSPIAREQQVSLELDLSQSCSDTFVMVDRDKIKQVLVNLIDNAIKYNRESGRVMVKSKLARGRLETSIEDTGLGIPVNLQSKIFSKFQQVQGSYTKENKGTGLGLFIVKSLVELHDGEIQVKSVPGVGSRFSFSLPTVA